MSSQSLKVKKELLEQLKLLADKSPEVYLNFFTNSQKLTHSIVDWNQTMVKVNAAKEKLTEDTTFFDTTLFLAIFEISYISLIDLICYLFIKNGFAFNEKNTIQNLEDIGKLNTSQKFKFLKKRHLDTLVRDNDRKLRNTIAHYNFTIIGRGKIKNQDNTEIDIVKRANELNALVKEIALLLADTTKIIDTRVRSQINETRSLMSILQNKKLKNNTCVLP